MAAIMAAGIAKVTNKSWSGQGNFVSQCGQRKKVAHWE
jgi:hypothetical protein